VSLLENELVRRFFGECEDHLGCNRDCMSRHILDAMQQPIKKGERYLFHNGEKLTEFTVTGAEADEPFHPLLLRLPDKFQPKQECDGVLVCQKCGHAPGYTCRMPEPAICNSWHVRPRYGNEVK
jgi:hypothetical protein